MRRTYKVRHTCKDKEDEENYSDECLTINYLSSQYPMTIGSILFGMALLLLVGLYLARPFLKREKITVHPATKREQLLNDKEALLTQIQQLDFDASTGKIPPEIHQAQREKMVAQAAAILQQLDALTTHPSAVGADIETAVAEMRQTETAVSPPHNDNGPICPQCSYPIAANDKFCTNCGQQLTTNVQPAPS